jgi:hypothetical protein
LTGVERDQLAALWWLTGVEHDQLAALWWLIALRGLRHGGAALDRDDLDSETRELTVSRH